MIESRAVAFLRSTFWRWTLVALLLASIPLYVLSYTLVPKSGDLGLSLRWGLRNSDGTRLPVLNVTPGSSAWRAGIRSGDTVIVSGGNGGAIVNPLPGDRTTLQYERTGEIRSASVVAANAVPTPFGVPSYVRAGVVGFLLIFALLVVVRAWNTEYGPLIATFLTTTVVNPSTDNMPFFGHSAAATLAYVGCTWLAAITFPAEVYVAFLLIDRLMIERSPSVRSITMALAVNTLVTTVLAPFVITAQIAGHAGPLLAGILNVCWVIVPAAASVVALPYAYSVSRGEERARMAWFFWAYFPYCIGSFVINAFFVFPQLQSFYNDGQRLLEINVVGRLLEIALPVALFYGILLRRAVDIGFIVNRAAVYGLISAVVLAIFVALEYLIGHFFFDSGRVASVALQLGVALIIGMSIRYLHGILDRFVDRVFFAKRHADEAALRRFAQEAEVFTSPASLLDRALEAVCDHSEARAAAIYLSDGNVARVERASSDAFPATIDLDDPLLVALRRWKEPCDTHDMQTAFPDGMAFPMIARGTMSGVLLCLAKRDATAYAPDERGPLADVAGGLARALDSLANARAGALDTIERSIAALDGRMIAIGDAVMAVNDAVIAVKDAVVGDREPL